jgi:hypothetical protein
MKELTQNFRRDLQGEKQQNSLGFSQQLCPLLKQSEKAEIIP